MTGPNTSVSVQATATIDAGGGALFSCSLCAGADAATAIVRTGGSGGTVICTLGGAAGVATQRTFVGGVVYANLHVTITGTTPWFDAEIGQ